MRDIILLLGAMSVNIFFALSSLIGYEFKGTEESKIYLTYVILVALLNIILFFHYIATKKIRLNKTRLIILLIPFIFIFIFLLTGLLQGYFNEKAIRFMGYFLLWGMPAIMGGVLARTNKLFHSMARWIELLMLLFTISIIKSNLIPYLGGYVSSSIGGATYQTASYIGALAFGINLYFIFFGRNHLRFKFTKNRIYKSITIIFLIIQIVSIFLTGGRGGMVLVFIYIMYISFVSLKHRENSPKYKLFLLGIFLATAFIILLPKLLDNPLFYSRFGRVFEFISIEKGINWSGTSNRDIVYSSAIQLISQKIFFGYGLFGFWNVSGYPHNIILEVLLNGGILYLLIFIIILITFFKRLKALIKYDIRYRLVVIISIYPLTHLMFSGSYMTSSEFWFVLAFVLSQDNLQRRKILYKEESENEE